MLDFSWFLPVYPEEKRGTPCGYRFSD